MHGVGFAAPTSWVSGIPKKSVDINEGLMTWRIPLIDNQQITVRSASAPTLALDEASKEVLYNGLHTLVLSIQRANMILLIIPEWALAAGRRAGQAGLGHVQWKLAAAFSLY